MKKLLFILTATTLLLLFAACGSSETPVTTEAGATSTIVTTSTTTPATTAETSADTTVITSMETTTKAPETTTKPEAIYETVQNPIYPTGNDPWVVEHDGKYYYCFSGGDGKTGGVRVAEIPSIHQVSDKNAKQVYLAPSGTMYSKEYWAPELHYIQGEWYIYVAADDGNNHNHRMYVLKGTSQDPTDPFEFVGKITDPTDKWAIDGTVLQWKDELYFVWSGWEGDENVAQNIYIAHMSDPCTIDSERVLLSAPTYVWERIGTPYVNEGPTALVHGDDAFIVYSASGSWTDNYCLGLLTLTGDDPLQEESWTKTKTSVFRQYVKVAFGPGHCSFTMAVDGSIWMIYHANLVAGTGWSGRSVWIAPITFEEDGTPIFGKPQKEVRFPVALK